MKISLQEFMHKMAKYVVEKRRMLLIAICAATAVFVFGSTRTTITTKLAELLPLSHPYVKTHLEYVEQLGDPFKIYLMLKVREGSIYNTKTLQKIKDITEGIDSINGVNHDQVYSLGSPKLKKVIIGEDGTTTEAIMPQVPKTDQEVQELRGVVRRTESVYGLFVSRDEKSALLTASFIPAFSDYSAIATKVDEIISQQKDSNHEFYASGEPLLAATIERAKKEMYLIFAVTFLSIIALLAFYFRDRVGVIVPVTCAFVCAIWGLGVVGLIKSNLDPLGLVVPVLITARALSHAVQMVERYYEEYNVLRDKNKAVMASIVSIFPPGALGIVTDVVGILLVALAPVPMIQKLAYLSSFWAISILFNGMLLAPILFTYLPEPANVEKLVQTEKGAVMNFLGRLGTMTSTRKSCGIILLLTLCLTIFGSYRAFQVNIGDVQPGSSILWPKSFYNISIDQINKSFPGVEELYVLVEGETVGAIKSPEIVKQIASFQRYMEEDKDVVTTFAIGDCIPPFYKNLNLGYPKWEVAPDDAGVMGSLIYLMTAGSSPGDYDKYFSRDFRSANVVVYYRDHKGDTVRNAMNRVKEFIAKQPLQGVKMRLASGYVGIIAAVNEAVESTQLLNFICVMGVTFLLCAATYRSLIAAILLAIPLNVTNIITLMLMSYLGIGLNLNTLPVVSLGIGIGIDYGIYLLSRICEEYQSVGNYEEASRVALKTTGKAIFFTATTMALGTIFWYFMSSLRFCAEMGLLLTFVMSMNMIMSMLLLPSLVSVFRPKFVATSGFKAA